jgi:molybdopterin synthase sulfur carrier subunit
VVTIVFLGKLADLAGAPSLQLAAPLDWAGLKAALPSALAEAVDDPRNRVALNGALLPPVSGG